MRSLDVFFYAKIVSPPEHISYIPSGERRNLNARKFFLLDIVRNLQYKEFMLLSWCPAVGDSPSQQRRAQRDEMIFWNERACASSFSRDILEVCLTRCQLPPYGRMNDAKSAHRVGPTLMPMGQAKQAKGQIYVGLESWLCTKPGLSGPLGCIVQCMACSVGYRHDFDDLSWNF